MHIQSVLHNHAHLSEGKWLAPIQQIDAFTFNGLSANDIKHTRIAEQTGLDRCGRVLGVTNA